MIVVGVEKLPEETTSDSLQRTVQDALQHYQETFYRMRLAAMNEGVQMETTIVLGDPVGELLRRQSEATPA